MDLLTLNNHPSSSTKKSYKKQEPPSHPIFANNIPKTLKKMQRVLPNSPRILTSEAGNFQASWTNLSLTAQCRGCKWTVSVILIAKREGNALLRNRVRSSFFFLKCKVVWRNPHVGQKCEAGVKSNSISESRSLTTSDSVRGNILNFILPFLACCRTFDYGRLIVAVRCFWYFRLVSE